MKKIFLMAAVLAAGAANAANYEVDTFHTNARFTIDHFGTSTNIGGIYGVKYGSKKAITRSYKKGWLTGRVLKYLKNQTKCKKMDDC